ncbi:MAG: hypothetical protein A3G37_00975 [Omnitrophica WOR_2 bacterium RIFCSPLOWO2_12_FULL_46_30]|nr:MAG: hypothetical protein A3D27_01220 [Omnitrophica WOR_2 bacterium RIFCSPHIGHO2_02_FULL_46_37]OGX43931.1 MAG: hypothetical protein A3H41_04910 [Omnitrophica WOR_2 bacterium RIFCSPLOWO2_02_FULL_45_28]OGX52100.1 MAG: hypothetical protein A3G37_00975 [Omnitrophica WOR_2 bacterium RIFCSPLOWO2_12_FULL_46_30]
MTEKRKYQRINDGVKIIYKVMGVKGEYPTPVLDMGAGGFRLPIKDKLALGSTLELNICLPDEKEPFFGLARVVWQKSEITKSEKGGYYETGVEFIRVGVQNRKLIIRYIASLIAKDKK